MYTLDQDYCDDSDQDTDPEPVSGAQERNRDRRMDVRVSIDYRDLADKPAYYKREQVDPVTVIQKHQHQWVAYQEFFCSGSDAKDVLKQLPELHFQT